MASHSKLPRAKDPTLFTPGPLTTSPVVKQAMLRDLGSRDREFLDLTQRVRSRLLQIAGVDSKHYTTVLLPGSGTYAVESVLTSCTPPEGELLIIANGAYGARMAMIARAARVPATVLEYAEDEIPNLREIETTLIKARSITNIAMVHCETTSGIVNPIAEVGELARRHGKTYFVDAMSSFGAMSIDMERCGIDYLVSSANKCLEGVPGMALVIARRESLERTEGWARSLSLDLRAQWADLETKGEFRYTPPIQVLLAMSAAIDELEIEGGVEARGERYRSNYRILTQGMKELGFRTYLSPEKQGPIITSFHYLEHPKFDYQDFYERLRARDIVIYSGKVSNARCFRVGNIGRIFAADIEGLLSAMERTLREMGVRT